MKWFSKSIELTHTSFSLHQENFKNHTVAVTSQILFSLSDPGRHALNIMWDGKHIPGSPAFFTVKGPAPARLCYILSGADHIKCSKGAISFRYVIFPAPDSGT